MKFIPNAVTAKVARQLLVTQKNSPAILFGAGVVGMVTTTVLACKATLKVEETLEATNSKLKDVETVIASNNPNYSDADAKKDKAYIYIRAGVGLLRLYTPAIICGVASVTALAGAQRILNSRNAALTAAYAALDRGFKQYRSRVSEELGEEKERDLYFDSQERMLVDKKTGKETPTGVKSIGPNSASIYARFFDEMSSSWQRNPEYNFMFLRTQQNYANDMLQARGHMFLNDVYDLLGIERSSAGSVVGWVISEDGDNFIDFGIFNGENPRARDFVNGREGSILLDFNVDGVIYDKIDKKRRKS